MKSSFTRFFVFALFACFGMKSFAETHIISHTEVAFSPINFNCIVGDVIRWEWSSGFHNTTSATVPQGAATWDSDLSQALPVFEYTVEVPGTYGYFCPFHISVGMAGAFIASLPVSVKPTLNT